MDDKRILQNITRFYTALSILVLLIVLSTNVFITLSNHLSSKEETVSGYIVNKEVIPANAFSFIFFQYRDTEYRFYINYDYEDIFGVTRQGSKHFSVDETTYWQYHIGDYFEGA